jgi:hypothetical protein
MNMLRPGSILVTKAYHIKILFPRSLRINDRKLRVK